MKFTIMAVIIALTIILFTDVFAQGTIRENQQSKMQVHKQFNFTEEQQSKVDGMKIAHQKEMIDLKASLQKKELEITELKNDGNYTREEYLNKVKEVIAARGKIAVSLANHQMDVYQILDENQKKEWNKMSNKFGERRERKLKRTMRNLDVE